MIFARAARLAILPEIRRSLQKIPHMLRLPKIQPFGEGETLRFFALTRAERSGFQWIVFLLSISR